MFFRSHLVLMLFTALWNFADPPKYFELPKTNNVVPKPMPVPAVTDPTITIKDGQWYVIPANCPLLFNQVSLGGELTINTLKKTTITLPVSWVIGGVPDTDDPDFCTITGKNLYAIKAKSPGQTVLVITPTVNRLDDSAKPVPFTAADVAQLTFNVSPMPAPPAVPPPIVPPPVALTPFQTKLQTAIKADAAPPASIAKYSALFKTAATTMVQDQTLKTGTDLLKDMQTAAKSLGIPAGSLNNVAKAVEVELNSLIAVSGALDQPSRDNIAALFTRVASDLLIAGGQ